MFNNWKCPKVWTLEQVIDFKLHKWYHGYEIWVGNWMLEYCPQVWKSQNDFQFSFYYVVNIIMAIE